MSRGNKLRHIRLDDATWEAFRRVADARGTNRAALIRAYILQELERSARASGDLLDPPRGSK